MSIQKGNEILRCHIHSEPNGIWNINAIQGKNHAPKLCENASQFTSPVPPPHSFMHCSYVRCSVGTELVEFVVFPAAACASLSLAPHCMRFTASTPVKHPRNTRKKMSRM